MTMYDTRNVIRYSDNRIYVDQNNGLLVNVYHGWMHDTFKLRYYIRGIYNHKVICFTWDEVIERLTMYDVKNVKRHYTDDEVYWDKENNIVVYAHHGWYNDRFILGYNVFDNSDSEYDPVAHFQTWNDTVEFLKKYKN